MNVKGFQKLVFEGTKRESKNFFFFRIKEWNEFFYTLRNQDLKRVLVLSYKRNTMVY